MVNAMSSRRICEQVNRGLKDTRLPSLLSPHSFRVNVTTEPLSQGVLLEDLRDLAGHAEARTTGIYERRKKYRGTLSSGF